MRFKTIEFENYRCFINGRLELDEVDGKNINLILGPNGGGKTEMLFAFWWTLYEFDFSRLRGKESTPYALNSDLYKELEQGNVGDVKSCSVILEFEHLNIRYRVKKEITYRKTEKQIRQEEYQEFSFYNDNGELSLPIRDDREIDRRINRIIPKAILDGIIFDGERMQKLSSADEKSKKAIQGVINDITNVELLENCITVFRDIRRELNSSISKLANQTKQKNLEDIIGQISADDTLIETDAALIKDKSERLEIVKSRIAEISEELKSIEGARSLELQRENEKREVENNNKLLDEYYKNFSASLKEAYLLNTGRLQNDVENIIQQIDVPAGLTVEAVRSVLGRPSCICGREIGPEQVKALNELIISLPPDNINSTLAEMLRQTSDKVQDVKSRCKENYKYITNCEARIKDSKDRIASISSQILSFNEKEAQDLENENTSLNNEKLQLNFDIEKLKQEHDNAVHERDDLIIQRDSIGKNNEETNRLNSQLDYVEKCLRAFDIIKEQNKAKALVVINEKLENAYELLSEDAELGNAIHIVQYEESKKYQMIVYLKKNAEQLYEKWKSSGVYDDYLYDGLNEDEIWEQAIIESADSNSTGQSKMNTLAFAKAILDYSNEQKETDGLEIQKEYPFLIDAPFSDIAGDNLIKAAKELHNFSGQILLMIDEDKTYESVKPYISSNVNKVFKLTKQSDRNVTSIEEE
ncbi:DNA sulfur modification protein DndD [Pseudobutyrivibrio ruminis]|uniref:Nuclease SbcCD subunit C n=1 Tax=Pseudobutyrivibrio ruminis TaxID=46206 RepID=A0A1H7F645_9FIRM|nr:AAA family ATPase [Pseudobutyrivibrio ruminis]SEK18645.1 DNA sulfur modification protein DndD [Pseudobutyrivibrio ruminis]